MVYSRVISDTDELTFKHRLDQAIEEETREGAKIVDVLFSTCPAALTPFGEIDNVDIYSVARYTAIVFFKQ